MIRILIIEDDSALAAELAAFLRDRGYETDISSNVRDTFRAMNGQHYDLCLMDVGLPDGTGFQLCRQLRATYNGPILMLTAYDSEDDVIRGLQCGADDYITKPCSLRVLATRIQAMLRRSQWYREDPSCLVSGDLTVDLVHKTVLSSGRSLGLGGTEFDLCAALIQGYGQILPRPLLLERIWDAKERFIEDNTLTVHMSRLRKKLGLYNGAPYIETVKGIGYRWNAEVRRG